MNDPRTMSRFARAFLPAALAVAALASPARAQISPVDAYQVVVTEDAVNLRCDAGTVWYPVAMLTKGDLLKVDGVGKDDWLRVSYPPGAPALVKPAEARLDAARGVVVLTKRTKLLAANMQGGVGESWHGLLDTELATGTELQSLGVVKDPSGAVAAYKVVAPEGSKGFVSGRLVRKATESEIAAAKGPGSSVPNMQPISKTPQKSPGTIQPVANQAPAGTNPAAAPGTNPATTPAGAQPTAAAPTQQPTGAPAGEQPAAAQPEPQAVAPAPKQPDRRVAEFEALNAKYEAIKKVPVENAEVEPLIAEYQRYVSTLGDGPQNATRRAVANKQIELLTARLDIKKARLAVADAQKDADKSWATVAEKKAALDAKPRYTVVGRLSASTVYDGDRLPLMFRVLSVEGFPGRTLAYVTPAPGVDVTGRVGTLVGVMGEGNVDDSLGVPVLRPSRIDPLSSTGAPLATPTTPSSSDDKKN